MVLLILVELMFFFVVGAAAGSFCGVLLERLPNGESIGGRSHCVCGEQLGLRENMPVLSWLIQGGKARCCDAQIPVWYLRIEVLFGTVVAVVAIAMRLLTGPTGGLVTAGVVVAALIGLVVLAAKYLRAQREANEHS